MSLVQDIDKVEKEATALIKEAEGQKAEIKKYNAEVMKEYKEISSKVKAVLLAFSTIGTQADTWESDYDGNIESMKQLVKDYSGYKKKSVEAEKFFKQLDDEKTEKDKVKKKAGSGYKMSKEDELFEVVYKKAKAAYTNDPTASLESCLKDLKDFSSNSEKSYKSITKDLKDILVDMKKLSAELGNAPTLTSYKLDDLDLTDASKSFDMYFRALS